MSDRYTSPETSRALAEAGIDQAWTQGRVFWDVDWCLTRASETYVGDGPPWKHVRALDLTDVLHEIETCGATWLVETDHDTYCATAVLNPEFSAVMGGPSAVEAAGLCLLALMDKLREAKP